MNQSQTKISNEQTILSSRMYTNARKKKPDQARKSKNTLPN